MKLELTKCPEVQIPSNCPVLLSSASPPPPLLLQILYERCDRMRPTLFRLASETMDDDSALTQILEANDKLTLVVSAFKEQAGRNAGRARSQSEEERAVKKHGTLVPHGNTSTSAQLQSVLILFLLVPAAPRSPGEIKSYHLIDLSALDSPQMHRKAESPPPVFLPLTENDLDLNGNGCSAFVQVFFFSFLFSHLS